MFEKFSKYFCRSEVDSDFIKAKLQKYIDEIETASDNSLLRLITRRQFALATLSYLAAANLSKSEKEEIRKMAKRITLEAWTKRILPKTSGILYSDTLKTHRYTNPNDFGELSVEPRSYTALSVHDVYDLDGPSLVTALTPPKYTQPWHAHAESDEVTFYADPAIVKYTLDGKEYSMEVPENSLVRVPKNTYHTISNPGNKVSLNMSIKMPQALLDRLEGDIFEIKGEGRAEILKPQVEQNSLIWDLKKYGLPYSVLFYDLESGKKLKLTHKDNYGLLYCISGEAKVEVKDAYGNTDYGVIRARDIVILSDESFAYIEALSDLRLYSAVTNI